MKKAIEFLNLLTIKHNQLSKSFYDNKNLITNYNTCIESCKRDNYKLCLFEETSTNYATATIKIYIPECSQIQDYTNIISFTDYIDENNSLKKLPYNCIGVIPNYKYVIGDIKVFENTNYYKRQRDYYIIDLKIPFIMDENL